MIFNFGNYFSDIFFNRLFRRIAEGKSNTALLLLTILFVNIFGVLTAFYVSPFLERYNRQKSVTKNETSSKFLFTSKQRFALFLLIVLGYSCIVSDEYVRMNAAKSFDQRLAIVTPYISDQKHKEILSSFASMEKKEDYGILCNQIDAIAKEKQIKVPPAYLKFITK